MEVGVLPGATAGEVLLAVEVRDTGVGIHPDELERIFEIFEQAQHGRTSGKGTGLGLPLSRRYAQALGGDLTVSSQPEVGSRFRFTFRAHLASDAVAGPPRLGRVLQLAADQPACHVLVVDDEPENLEMLSAILEPVGFVVQSARSAAQALERLGQAEAIDLVLMDLRMPEMDGYEAIGHLRALPHGRELPVLVVTASGFEEEPRRALDAGANGYCAKPLQREPLMAEISRVTGVRYEYETPEPVSPTFAPLKASALAGLPVARLRLLDQALLHGDIGQLRGLIEEMAGEHAGLAAGLRVLVDAYDYDRLHVLVDAAKKGTVA